MLDQASHKRPTRRRERPGARARRAVARKSLQCNDITEGYDLAHLPTPITSTYIPKIQTSKDLSWKQQEDAEIQREYEMMVDRERIEMAIMQRRFFGGDEADDDVSLLPAMLDVVYSLWGGIDYTDP